MGYVTYHGWRWSRGYVYDWSGDLLAMQYNGAVSWYHQDPVVKSRRVVNAAGATTSAVELDPWGAATSRMVNSGQQPRLFTSYLRDGVGSDDAQNRRYNRYYARFEQPDPADSSYDLADPQSFNRYSYTQNDPVNFVDPSGLNLEATGGGGWTTCVRYHYSNRATGEGFWGGWMCSSSGGGEEGGGAVIDPHNTDSKDKGTDCTRFAAEVGQIASKYLYDLPGLANALNVRFAPEGERRSNNAFASGGFRSEFKDDTPSQPGLRDNTPNQARHYVGGFRSFVQWGIIGGAYANYRESPGVTYSEKADLALNRVSTQHAQILAMNPAKIPELKDMILRDVCE